MCLLKYREYHRPMWLSQPIWIDQIENCNETQMMKHTPSRLAHDSTQGTTEYFNACGPFY